MRNLLWILAFFPLFAGATSLHLDVVAMKDAAGRPIEKAVENMPVRLELRLLNLDTGQAVVGEDLEIVHERPFHLFAFDAGLTNYLHEHPDSSRDTWSVPVTFRRSGTYRIWADITLKRDVRDGGAENKRLFTTLSVGGSSSPLPMPRELKPKAEAVDGISIARLEGVERLRAGRTSTLKLLFARTDGTEPEIRPYLGALAHTVITDLSGTELLHTHPLDAGGTLLLHTVFPRAGDYRLFIQFVDGGNLRTVEHAVRVQP